MIVYVVEFEYDGEHSTEGIFKTKEDARNYIYNESLERGLYKGEIWITEREIQSGMKRYDDNKTKEILKSYEMYEDEDDVKSLLGWIDEL